MLWLQGECAQACNASETCLACSEPLPAESLHALSSGKHLKEKARALGLHDPDTIMAAASSGVLAINKLGSAFTAALHPVLLIHCTFEVGLQLFRCWHTRNS
jgi:hypothetical protein